MSKLLRHAVTRSSLGRVIRTIRHAGELSKWEKSGRPAPPPFAYKLKVLRSFAERYQLRTFVETGTYLGDMDYALRSVFSRIVTIELSEDLHAAARRRFAKLSHMKCLHGDSSVLLPELLATIEQPCLFWLDAHYSAGFTARGAKDTPISVELDAVLRHPIRHHVVLIDDARCFDGMHDYPLLCDLENGVTMLRPDLSFAVEHDIIRIFPSVT
jgi:hypothetical protein